MYEMEIHWYSVWLIEIGVTFYLQHESGIHKTIDPLQKSFGSLWLALM